MLHEGIIEKAATEAANLADGVDTEKVFRLVAEVSNTKTDAHYHVIMPDFLTDMAQTMKTKKTPFLLDHNTDQKIGKSIDGYTEGEDMKMRALGVFDVPRDWNLKVDTNEFIKGVKNDALDAVSVGIRVKDATCNLCKKQVPKSIFDLFMGDPEKLCLKHRPGREYKNKLAKWNINKGFLNEVSSVYAGANYTAEIIDYTKAMLSQTDMYKDITDSDLDNIMPFMPELSDVTKMDPALLPTLHTQQFSFPNPFNLNPKPNRGKDMSNEMDFEKELAKLCGQASAFMKELPEDPIKAIGKIIEDHQTVIADKKKLESDLAESKVKADKFDEHYNEKIETALKYGVIAEGEDFDKDKWEKILKGYGDLSLVDIQLEKWQEEADEELPDEQGRQSKDLKPSKAKGKSDDDDENDEVYDDSEDY